MNFVSMMSQSITLASPPHSLLPFIYVGVEEYPDSISAEGWDAQPVYNTKLSDDEAPVMEPWGMWSTPSLPLLPCPHRSGVVVPVRVSSMGQIERFDYSLYLKPFKFVQTNEKCWIELLVFDSHSGNTLLGIINDIKLKYLC